MTEKGRYMGKAGARIEFICMMPTHLDTNGALVDHLTVHEKEWAYCPFDVRKGEHDWKPTGGVSMGEIEIRVRGMRERGAGETRGKGR